jgi:hypothetical protein
VINYLPIAGAAAVIVLGVMIKLAFTLFTPPDDIYSVSIINTNLLRFLSLHFCCDTPANSAPLCRPPPQHYRMLVLMARLFHSGA